MNYLSNFYLHFSDDCKVLRQLAQRENTWGRTGTHEEAYCRFKARREIATALKYYKSEEQHCSATHQTRTGSKCDRQRWEAVALRSRGLTIAEKDCLAIVLKIGNA